MRNTKAHASIVSRALHLVGIILVIVLLASFLGKIRVPNEFLIFIAVGLLGVELVSLVL